MIKKGMVVQEGFEIHVKKLGFVSSCFYGKVH